MTSPTEISLATSSPSTSEISSLGFRVDNTNEHFKTLKADRTFWQDEVLIDLQQAETHDAPNYATIDLHNRHVLHPVGRYINHSCEPTAYIDLARQAVVALREIQPGDEITFNYLTTERRIVAPFDCHCGSERCVRRVE